MRLRCSNGTVSVWFPLQVLYPNPFKHPPISRLYGLIEWLRRATVAHALLKLHRALLLAQHHARSRPNLNQSSDSHSSEATHERFDKATMVLTANGSHKDCSHAVIPGRHRDGHSSFDHAFSDRMRRRRGRARQRSIGSTSRSYRISRMASGSRPLSRWLLRLLWPTITRSIGKLLIRKFRVR